MIAVWHGKAISANMRLIRGNNRWVPNPRYKAFKQSLIWVLKSKWGVDPIEYPVVVRLYIELNPRIDAQNILKPAIDAIEQAGVIKNDKQVWELHMYRFDKIGEDDIIKYVIEPLSKQQWAPLEKAVENSVSGSTPLASTSEHNRRRHADE